MKRETIKYGYDGNPIRMIVSILVLILIESILYGIQGKLFHTIANILLPFVILGLVICIRMTLYVKFGKFHQRDDILSKVNWKGNEMVLDIGTGRGLLMIGAAKRLSEGKSIGIDIWRQEDMANNCMEKTMQNVRLEGVTEKVEVKSEDIRKTSFGSNTFDVVLSNLCIHNIAARMDREDACREIHRILKQGGKAVIGDLFFRIKEYSEVFKALGMSVEKYKGKSVGGIQIPIVVVIKK